MTDPATQPVHPNPFHLNPVHNPIPYLSVIIPIYNGEANLPGLLACLTAQTYPRDRVEYLIVDNGSTDDTLALLQAFETQGIVGAAVVYDEVFDPIARVGLSR